MAKNILLTNDDNASAAGLKGATSKPKAKKAKKNPRPNPRKPCPAVDQTPWSPRSRPRQTSACGPCQAGGPATCLIFTLSIAPPRRWRPRHCLIQQGATLEDLETYNNILGAWGPPGVPPCRILGVGAKGIPMLLLLGRSTDRPSSWASRSAWQLSWPCCAMVIGLLDQPIGLKEVWLQRLDDHITGVPALASRSGTSRRRRLGSGIFLMSAVAIMMTSTPLACRSSRTQAWLVVQVVGRGHDGRRRPD